MMERVVKFLKEAETYYLATVEGDQPRVRPFGTVNVFEGKLYIQTGKCKDGTYDGEPFVAETVNYRTEKDSAEDDTY